MILVVDDHDDTRYALTRLLASGGYEAIGVCDGRQALLFLQTHSPRLVILDCHMPCMGGFDVLRTIRSDAALAHVPVVMFSADSAAEAEALRLGARGFILKGSLDWARLSEAVQRYAAGTENSASVLNPAEKKVQV
jgi:CheY-like chemotaxis protein